MRLMIGMAALACGLALAGCNKPKGPPTAEEIRAEAAKLPRQKPGLYVSSTRMLDFALTGGSPDEAARMREGMLALGQQRGTQCLTQAQADGGFDAMVRGLKAGNCKTESFAVDKGQLNARLVCASPQGVVSNIAIKGTSTVETTHASVTIEQAAPGRKGVTMKMVMEADSYRKGDCDAVPASPAPG